MIKNIKGITIIIIILIIVSGIMGYSTWKSNHKDNLSQRSPDSDIPAEEDGVRAADNVFVAKVIDNDGNNFNVDVILNIKGNFQGITTIYDGPAGQNLKLGTTYLLLTTNTSRSTSYPAIISYRFVIAGDSTLTREQLEAIAKNDLHVITYKQYYERTLSKPESKLPEVHFMQAQFPADYSDDRVLIGSAHNVFIGKVIRQIEYKDSKTKYEVEVVDNIKGNLEGTVTVVQDGGLRDGVLYVMVGDILHSMADQDYTDYLFQPGRTYLI